MLWAMLTPGRECAATSRYRQTTVVGVVTVDDDNFKILNAHWLVG